MCYHGGVPVAMATITLITSQGQVRVGELRGPAVPPALSFLSCLSNSEHVKECLSTWAHTRLFNRFLASKTQHYHRLSDLYTVYTTTWQTIQAWNLFHIRLIWIWHDSNKICFCYFFVIMFAFTLITLVKITVLWGHTSSPQSQNYI